MSDLMSVIISALLAFGVALATLWLAKRAGLTDVQREVRLEGDRLVAQLKDRVALLEAERREDKGRIAELERENTELRRRVERLERAIADQVIYADD
jgi:biopolymer transport protein ExbB/TolQ